MYESSNVDEVLVGIFGHLFICNRAFYCDGLLREHPLPVNRVSIPTSSPRWEDWKRVWLTPVVEPALRSEPVGCLAQQLFRPAPAKAAVRDRHAVTQRRAQRLAAFEQMALDHHADQRSITLQALFKHVVEHGWLTQRVFAAVGMAAVDHDPCRDLQSGQIAVHLGDAVAVVVRPAMAATQHQVGVGIARRLNDCRMPLAIDAEMAMRMGGRAHGVAGDSRHRHRCRS